MSIEMPSKRGSVTSRALSILDTFRPGKEWQTLSEISRASHLPIATTHRLANELLEWGALERRANYYTIGHRIWRLGHLSSTQRDISEVASPFLQDVLFVTQNVVNFFVPDGLNVLLVERKSGTLIKEPSKRAGEHVSYTGSAGGKVLLAHASEAVIEAVLNKPARHTTKSIVDPATLRREIEKTRQQGFATSTEETAIGNFGIAVPVVSADNTVIAAIGVVTVNHAAAAGSIVPVLRIAARGIARQLETRS